LIGENRKEQDMMKRIAAVAAISLVALQLGAGSAFAAGKALGKNKGAGTPATAQCSLIAGTAVISSGSGNDASVWTDGEFLYCGDTWTGTDPDTYGDDDAPPLSEVDSVLVQGDSVTVILTASYADASPVLVLTNAKAANFGAEIQGSGIIKIHRAPSDDSSTHKASFIAIKNLKMVGAKSGNYYYDYTNTRVAYGMFTSAIYVVRVGGLLLENNEIMDNGNGVFVNTRGISPIDFSSNVILRGNRIEGNGYMTDDHEHGTYIEARRVLYEGNYYGPARGGAALKDRSSGTVVRYNKIVAGARALDLVDSDEAYNNNIFTDPLYNSAWVYGNVIVNDYASTEGFSIRLIHWGFDQDAARCRNGRLYFYGNTVVHLAASRGDNEMIKFLVSKGADVKKVNRSGQTTIDVANGPVQRTQPYPETIKLLESLGAVNNHKCVSC